MSGNNFFQSAISLFKSATKPTALSPKEFKEEQIKKDLAERKSKSRLLTTVEKKEIQLQDNILHSSENYNNIYWIRHAESCSNRAPIIDMVKATKVLSSIGSSIVSSLLLTKSDTSIIMSTCGDNCRQPPLSLLGILQAQYLGKTILPHIYKNGEYEAIYCSPSIRTIMTALYSLRNINRLIEESHKKLKIIIVPWISEKRNMFGDYDKQNGLMPPDNLKVATNAIKSWMETEFSDIFIDNEFYSILLEIKEFINSYIIKNTNETINKILKGKYDDILEFQKDIKKEGEFKKDESIVLATENTKRFMKNLSIFISELFAIGNKDFNGLLEKLNKFISADYLRGPEIDFKYYSDNYSKAIEIQKKCEKTKKYEAYYKNFFIDCINNIEDAKHNILVFSHGGIIKEVISDMDPSNNTIYKDEINHPKNTNIILTQYKKSANDILTIQYLNNVSPKLLTRDSENGCDKIHDIFDRINKIYDYNKLISQAAYNKLSQEEQKQINEENRIVTNMSRRQTIKNKYLKYKNKYLELKKLL